jgi:hypothetical protein
LKINNNKKFLEKKRKNAEIDMNNMKGDDSILINNNCFSNKCDDIGNCKSGFLC